MVEEGLELLRTEVGTEVDGNIIDDINLSKETEIKVGESKLRARCWMIVINNPSNSEHDCFASFRCRYKTWQLERGKVTGTLHLQGAIYDDKLISFEQLKEVFPRAALFKAKKTKAVLAYCRKSDTRVEGPYERGTCPAQGQRSDLQQLCDKMVEKKLDMTALAREDSVSYVKWSKGLKALKTQLEVDRNFEPEKLWLGGGAGVGKTKYAIDRFGQDNIYIKDGTKWWDGYENEQCILVDDFDGSWPFRDFLRFLDRNKYQGQVKGGYVKINSPVIIITCEFMPEHFYLDVDMEDEAGTCNRLRQVLRRFHKIITLKSKDNKGCREPIREEIWVD